jgi:glycosyltransferase involved in cell wall biosynthesis
MAGDYIEHSGRSLRILVATNHPRDMNSGAAGTVYQMIAALRRAGHDVNEIWEDDIGRLIRHGNLHYLLELPRKYRSAVRRRLREREYDVVEINLPQAYLAAVDHKRSGQRSVFVNRSHGHEVRSEEALAPYRAMFGVPRKPLVRRILSGIVEAMLSRQWKLLGRAADGFVVSCHEDATFLVERYRVPHCRIGVITQGVPESLVWKTPNNLTPERANKLLYVGQFTFFKAPMMLAQTVSLVLQKRPAASMTWVCSRSHHAEAADLLDVDVRPRVTFLDWMPQEELVRVFDAHGVFLFPSFFEGFGKAPLEAMARGLCVIASETGGMRDYIVSGENGLLVPVGRSELMAERAFELMSDPVRCLKMSAAARQTACQHTWDRCARDAAEFYERLLAMKK